MSRLPKIVVILGPNASGKSKLAVEIAKKYNCEIISADSRQVYKGLNIGSGKITKKEMAGIPHHLLDVTSPKKTLTVAQYQKLGKKAIGEILKRGKLPIICGGTGFYIDALLSDYKLPAVPPQPKLRKELDKKSTEELFKELKKLDPRRAQNIDSNNRRRLIRALEIILTTNKPVPLLNNTCVNQRVNLRESATVYAVLKIGVKKSSTKLQKLIAQRLEKRLKEGMIEEVEKLRKEGLSWKRLDDLGLEYRYISHYLHDLISYDEMKSILKKEIFKYAKRQMTWFKRDKEINWITNPKEAFGLSRDFLGL